MCGAFRWSLKKIYKGEVILRRSVPLTLTLPPQGEREEQKAFVEQALPLLRRDEFPPL
jgi:hypothetical protein